MKHKATKYLLLFAWSVVAGLLVAALMNYFNDKPFVLADELVEALVKGVVFSVFYIWMMETVLKAAKG